MSTALAATQLTEVAAEWRSARQLYPVYAAVVRQYGIGIEPSRDLEYPVDRPEPEAAERIRHWFAEADAKIQPWHLRQVLQTSNAGSEPTLRALITRLLQKDQRTDADRDKVDFLLAQYFFHCAPAKMHQGEPTLDEVAEVLEPVLGESIAESPSWLAPLEALLAELRACASLRDLLQRGLLRRARGLKTGADEKFFGSSALLSFARFNLIVRGLFVRLIHGDLHAIRVALQGLEQRGQKTFDGTCAGLGKAVTAEQVRLFCQDWKAMFRAEYDAGKPFRPLGALRTRLEAVLAAPATHVAAAAPEPAKAAGALRQAAAPALPSSPKAAPPKAAAVAAAPPIAAAAKQAKVSSTAPSAAVVQKEVAAAYEPEPKPATKGAPKPGAVGGKLAAGAAAVAPADVDGCLERIAEQLLRDSPRTGTTVTAVVVAGHMLMLSSWEVAAFVEGGDDVADALQRAVGARALLARAAEDQKQGIAVDVRPVLAAAHAEAAALQAHIARAKEAKNIDGAVNLAASARRLIGLMETLEGGPKPQQRSAP